MAGEIAPIWVWVGGIAAGTLITLIVTRLFRSADKFLTWARAAKREQMNTELLAAIDKKLDERAVATTALAADVKILAEGAQDTRHALELHTDQEAELVNRAVTAAIQPIVTQLTAQSAEIDRRFEGIESRLKAADI